MDVDFIEIKKKTKKIVDIFDIKIKNIFIFINSKLPGMSNCIHVNLRLTLHVNRCTPDCIIYGETGRGAILNVVNYRMVSFWSRLVLGKESKYSYILYNLIKCMHVDSNTQYTSKWINMIEDTLNRTGVGQIWLIEGSLYNTECIKTGYN